MLLNINSFPFILKVTWTLLLCIICWLNNTSVIYFKYHTVTTRDYICPRNSSWSMKIGTKWGRGGDQLILTWGNGMTSPQSICPFVTFGQMSRGFTRQGGEGVCMFRWWVPKFIFTCKTQGIELQLLQVQLFQLNCFQAAPSQQRK